MKMGDIFDHGVMNDQKRLRLTNMSTLF